MVLSDAHDLCAGWADKPYHSEYVDLVRFNTQGKIEQIKMFADHVVSRDHLEEHEGREAKDE